MARLSERLFNFVEHWQNARMTTQRKRSGWKWLLSGMLLLSNAGPLLAQSTELDAPAVIVSQPAFKLEIQAPDEVRSLLEKHLELLRYRELQDLSEIELQRLSVAAQQNTRELLATLGYFSPEIRLETLPESSKPAVRVLQLSVVPGEPARVAEVKIEFHGPIQSDAQAQQQRQLIESSWSLRPGARFTQDAWDSAKRQALRQLMAQRYAGATLGTTLADVDPDSHSVHITFTLESGPAYKIGRIAVSGTQHHDADIVRRLAHVPAETDYAQADLALAQQRLIASGYFDSASLALDLASDPTAATVQIQVREAKLQKLVLGIGASTDTGMRVTAEHTHNQVPGIDWRAITKLSIARNTRAIGSELTSPPDENNWRWITALKYQIEPMGSFEVSSEQVRVGHDQDNVRLERYYYLQYDRSITAASASTPEVTAESVSANYTHTWRRFDNLIFPSNGWGLGLEFGGGSTVNGPADPYGRFVARWLNFLPLDLLDPQTSARSGRVALRAQGAAVVARANATLPSTQMFLSGGSTTVRGYAYQSIGVKLPDGQTTAGRYLAMGSLEWQHPIVMNDKLTEWEAAMFVDAAAVANTPAALRSQVGVGAGARWRSPIGPLQLDLAYGVAVRQFRLHMNLGFTF